MEHEIRANHPASFVRPDQVKENLYIIAPIINSQRYKKRWSLYLEFQKMVLDRSEAVLYTVECSFGEREQVFTETASERHVIIHVRTKTELWMKENLINLAISRLPYNWKYVAWVDTDVTFARPDWVGETVQQLQHFDVVQMFSDCQDLSNDFEAIDDGLKTNAEKLPSMMHQWVHGKGFNQEFQLKKRVASGNYYEAEKFRHEHFGHPGYAWAATRKAIDTLGGLIDFSICGANDRHMAYGLVGMIRDSVNPAMSKEFLHALDTWQERAIRLKHNVGYVKGLILHHWHGNKKNRRYNDRWKILIEHKFNPYTDIFRDSQGLYQLNPEKWQLRDDLRAYFTQRNEDELS